MSYHGPSQESSTNLSGRNTGGKLPQYAYCKTGDLDYVTLHRAGHFNRQNKRLRKTVRAVPWRDDKELETVGRSLFSVLDFENDVSNEVNDDRQTLPPTTTSELLLEEAFATISVWKSRSALDGLPHAIESTAALAQIYWKDSQRRMLRLMTTMPSNKKWSNSYSSPSVMDLRLAYSAAIVRCINGFADSLQQQRATAASVSALCGQLGIPSWLVDTRHESSHNALPNIEVLRLSASTLLEFMKSEYWIPRCPEWNNNDDKFEPNLIESKGRPAETPNAAPKNLESESEKLIDILIEYDICASNWDTNRATTTDENGTACDKMSSFASNKQRNKRKKESLSAPPKTRILPYDPLFGESGTLDSSDDDGSSGAGYTSNKQTKLNKPAVNSIWGSSVGTNSNRYMLLELDFSKKKKKKGRDKDKKKQQLSKPNNIKKKRGEKSPTDYAKLFVRSVCSPQDGYLLANQYLIWGGVGGAPLGRGVLIPESEVAFPATAHGVTKCWQRYSPLIHVISRAWPGFAACMTTHLIDRMLSIEDISMADENDTNQMKQRLELWQGQTRSLFFLSAWIRLLLSQRFVAALDQRLSVTSLFKNVNPLELPLARFDHLKSLGYSLNSLLDRCYHFNDNKTNSTCSNPGLIKAIQDVIQNLEAILGENKTRNFGYSETLFADEAPSLSNCSEVDKHDDDSKVDTKTPASAMSLDEMEKLLLLDNNNNDQIKVERAHETKVGYTESKQADIQSSGETMVHETKPLTQRSAWVQCDSWDACAIGTLPGYPC